MSQYLFVKKIQIPKDSLQFLLGFKEMEESPTGGHCCQLRCCVTLESLNGNGLRFTTGRSVHKNAMVLVGRNESRDIVLQISLGYSSISYLLTDVKVFHKFATTEGRGCIQIPSKGIQILLSNCPAQKAKVFLKTLEAKLELMRSWTPTRKNKRRIELGLPHLLDKLSPLTLMEIRSLGGAKSSRVTLRDISNCVNSGMTPKSSKSRDNSAATLSTSQPNLKRTSARFQSSCSPPKKVFTCPHPYYNSTVNA